MNSSLIAIGTFKGDSFNNPPLFILYAILLMPVFSNYVFIGQISIGDLLFFTTIPWLIRNYRMDYLSVSSLIICIVIVLLSFVYFSIDDAGDYLWQILRMSLYFTSFFLIVGQSVFDYRVFFKHYTALGLFFSISIIAQWFVYHFLGYSIPFQLPLPYFEPDTLTQIEHVYRSGGFFKEPSYFSIYVTPLLFYFAITRKYKQLFLVVVAGVMTTSSLFLFLLILVIFFLPARTAFSVFIFCVALCSVVFGIVDGLLDDVLFIVRFVAIFVDGGTLNDRFMPILNLLSSSKLFYSLESFRYLSNSGFWFSSVGAILSGLGALSLVYLSVCFYRFGFIFGSVLVAYLLTTHFMSGVYSAFVFFSFFSLRLLLRDNKS